MPTTVIPELFDCTSGAAGDVIHSRNASGPYVRPNSPVTNPDTTLQAAVRDAFASLQGAWRTELTQSQRSAWDTYALGNDLHNQCGQPYIRHAKGEWLHANIARVQAGLDRIDTPPSTYRVPPLAEPSYAQAENVEDVTITFDMQSYADADGAALLFYVSPPLPLTHFFHRRPHNFFAAILGDSASPPTSPQTVTMPFGITEPANLNFRCQLVTPDGRVSQSNYKTAFWDTPPKPLAAFDQAGPEIVVQFDKALDPTITGSIFNVAPRRAPRTDSTSWRFLAGTTLFIDAFEPEYLYVISNGSTSVVTQPPAVGYQHAIAPFLKHSTLPLIVQPFNLDVT